jgi:hypothetical protein
VRVKLLGLFMLGLLAVPFLVRAGCFDDPAVSAVRRAVVELHRDGLARLRPQGLARGDSGR